MTLSVGLKNLLFLLSAMLLPGFGGCGARPATDSVKWVDQHAIQQGPTLHDSLPDQILERIKIVHSIFADVDGTPLDKWIDDFKRDLDPEGNVKIWEEMAVAYSSFCNKRELPLETRKEVFKVVLLRSMMPDEDVLARVQLKLISVDEAKAIMAAYPGEATPIEVVRQ